MKYRVSDVARVLGLTSGALHYFEREKLLSVQRDASGHRFYDTVDIFRLLSYRKYKSMGFGIKTVARQFSGAENDRRLIEERVARQRDEALKMARHYEELADYIQQHLNSIGQIDRLLGQFELAYSPEVLFLFEEGNGWISDNPKAGNMAQRWVEAMPATRLALLMGPNGRGGQAQPEDIFGYSVLKTYAGGLGLPLSDNVITLPRSLCVHTVAAADDRFVDDPGMVFEEGLGYLKQRGFEQAGQPWGNILLVEVAPEARLKPYVELWLPIK